MFFFASSVIFQYAHNLQQFLLSQTVLAPLLLLFIEESGIPLFIPGDIILSYTGYNIYQNPGASMLLAFCVALTAVLCGSSILFFAARRWGKTIVDKLGKFLFIKHSDIVKAEELFQKYGWWTILIGRHIPGMRIPLTIFAGVSGMRYRTFILTTFTSTALWVALFLSLGHRFGGKIESIIQHSTKLGIAMLLVIVLSVVGVHFWGVYRRKHKV
jgi:membrane protein DedA with SNARE-associated domain